ncbi:thrombopoietin [Xenopus laevis]|uniref:Thrombopoietin n=2 Tax=Xenopus laevis TaxID=8355 RepID=A0A0U5APJ9_XENLA|nr:thrombopoietin [Xenopus laevis]BAU21062.1 similar to thrombopoietin [Xenopus laevis]
MDMNRICLLIILMLSPEMSPMKICDLRLIKLYVNRVRVLERKSAQCTDRPPLLVPIIVPNVEVRLADWQNMTELQQGTEILLHLKLLLNATENVKTPECLSQQLIKITHNIKETYGLINKALERVSINSIPVELSVVPSDSRHISTSDSTEIFNKFLKLLLGKMSLFLHRLRESPCR